MDAKTPRSGSAVPDPGQPAERCPHCLQTYVYELEVRCLDCDEPMCPLCVAWVRGRAEARCARCREAG